MPPHNIVATDEEKIAEMYVSGMKMQEIADELGCSKTTIHRRIENSDVQSRDASSWASSLHPSFWYEGGYFTADSRTSEGRKQLYVHRLTCFAHFDGGMEDFKGKQVHHRNKYKWDNRPKNLEAVGFDEHQAIHMLDEWREEDGWPVLMSPEYDTGE